MRVTLCAIAVLVVSFGVVLGVSRADDDAKPEYTIKQVMKKAHKEGLLKKVAGGNGNKADAEQLLDLYESLAKNEPPKGSAADWKKKTVALVDAAEAVVDGKSGAAAQLKKASNCAACHKAHKPS